MIIVTIACMEQKPQTKSLGLILPVIRVKSSGKTFSSSLIIQLPDR